MTARLEKRRTKSDAVREHILGQIQNGNYPRGAVLPPERELAESLGVSYMTLRKAMGELVDERYLERTRGVGTFVRQEIEDRKVKKLLGVVVSSFSAPEHSDFIMYVTQLAEQSQWLVRVCHLRSWEERTLLDLWKACDAIMVHNVLELSLMPSMVRRQLVEGGKPVVFACTPSAQRYGFDSVFCMPLTNITPVLETIYSHGHRRFAQVEQWIHVNGKPQPLHMGLQGMASLWRELRPDTSFDEESLAVEVERYELPHAAVYRRLMERLRSTGATILLLPLGFYWGVLAALHDLGLRVPEDISLICFGDRQETEFYRPRPTVLCAPQKQQAEQAFSVVKWRTGHGDRPQEVRVVHTEFIEGQTLGPAPSGPSNRK